MSKSTKNNYYLVVKGRKPGLYTRWFGQEGAADQVSGIPGAVYKGFVTLEEAREWLGGIKNGETLLSVVDAALAAPGKAVAQATSTLQSDLESGAVIIFTDGGCDPNPGPGGYGVVMLYSDFRKELSGGFRLTTNNRMELTACIEGLKLLKRPLPVILYSDSQYVVNGITLGWAKRWRARGWYRTKEEMAENADLWAELLELTERYQVEFRWVRGHMGIPENERCDKLATMSRQQPGLPSDTVYETRKK